MVVSFCWLSVNGAQAFASRRVQRRSEGMIFFIYFFSKSCTAVATIRRDHFVFRNHFYSPSLQNWNAICGILLCGCSFTLNIGSSSVENIQNFTSRLLVQGSQFSMSESHLGLGLSSILSSSPSLPPLCWQQAAASHSASRNLWCCTCVFVFVCEESWALKCKWNVLFWPVMALFPYLGMSLLSAATGVQEEEI